MSKKESKLIPDEARKLYFDIGNSAIKLCYRDEGQWVKPVKFRQEQRQSLAEWVADARDYFDSFIISSVSPDLSSRLFHEIDHRKCIVLRTRHIPPGCLDYETPETLGIDRYLVGLGAWSTLKDRCVVIDAGTACTVDYIDGDGVYQGGAILPGLTMLEHGIQQFTPGLPEVERKVPSNWPGKSTRECLQWGIMGGFTDALERALERYQDFGDFTVFMTGGEAEIIAQTLDREVTKDQTLIFKGMEHFVEELLEQSE